MFVFSEQFTTLVSNSSGFCGARMVEISTVEDRLLLHVCGADVLWAFKGSLEIPLAHIAGIRADSEVARGWWHGFRLIGTEIPGVLHAGTFYQHGKRIFWDVHKPENTVVIELHDERYAELIVEVANPMETVAMVNAVLPAR